MSKISNIEGFLNLKLNQIRSRYNSEIVVLYRNFYESLGNDQLQEIFSILHKELNELFTFMNNKNSFGNGGHFNANESRELIWIIEQIPIIQETVKDKFNFELDEYYKEILNECKKFLSMSSGSSIPDYFKEINIIESNPIFNLSNTTIIQGPIGQSTIKLKLIGEGSYAKVYKYKDPYYGYNIAVKKAHKDLRVDELERFNNEFKDLKELDSPFIIKAYTYNKENNEYSMEYADETIDKFIEKNNTKMHFGTRRVLINQLLNAFEYIHSKKILHRDISYQNVLVKLYDDNSVLVKISDFGLVKRIESSLTLRGTEVKGSLNDFSDLSTVGFENYGIQHETYALARVIYYILCGRKTNYHLEKNIDLKKFILKGISSNKKERYESVEEMRTDLIKVIIPSLQMKDS